MPFPAHLRRGRVRTLSPRGGRGMSQPYGHPCEAEGCDALTRPEELMCRHHWFMVPAPLQKKVIQTWRQAQETGNFKLHAAAKAAAVKAVEARTTRVRQL